MKDFFTMWTPSEAYEKLFETFQDKEDLIDEEDFKKDFKTWLLKKSETIKDKEDFDRTYRSKLFSRIAFFNSKRVFKTSFPIWVYEEWRLCSDDLKNKAIPNFKKEMDRTLLEEVLWLHKEGVPIIRFIDDLKTARDRYEAKKNAGKKITRKPIRNYFENLGWPGRAAYVLQTYTQGTQGPIKIKKFRRKHKCIVKNEE
ncbi:hypothetical protein [Turicimonas muris]|jgi:hypothetical protein|uniref:hypothetical protein n=1 Tax=Turicimonas muris TaxID=1796652 RepID=UPI00248AC05F|nr:hypothetical protein [Turicimonas muris]